jgi:hypothetical protein
MFGGFAAQSDLGSVHAINARIAERRLARRQHHAARQEPELHQALGVVRGQVDVVERALLALGQINEA